MRCKRGLVSVRWQASNAALYFQLGIYRWIDHVRISSEIGGRVSQRRRTIELAYFSSLACFLSCCLAAIQLPNRTTNIPASATAASTQNSRPKFLPSFSASDDCPCMERCAQWLFSRIQSVVHTMSGIDAADLICEFLECCAHRILYMRDIYPASLFERTRKYGLMTWTNRHPLLVKYLREVCDATRASIRQGSAESFCVCISSDSRILERFVFEVRLLPVRNGD
jgi:hypothetical protein